jgi:hypothetical protein
VDPGSVVGGTGTLRSGGGSGEQRKAVRVTNADRAAAQLAHRGSMLCLLARGWLLAAAAADAQVQACGCCDGWLELGNSEVLQVGGSW